MSAAVWLYLLGWLCLAAILKFYPWRSSGRDLTSFDVVTLMTLAGRKSKVTG